MKKFIPVVLLGFSIISCQKQQSEEARRAEVEKQVQERLAAEHQQQEANELSQREAAVNAREQEERNRPARQNTTVAQESQTERAPEETVERGQPTGSFSMFYDKLEPCGDWIETSDYGYVYRPREASGGNWRPYANGRWVYTEAGWTWISEEPFGWATYHYGRWTRLRGVDWIWVPGNQWAPAWVSWRKGGEYVGWAPLPPEARFDRKTGIQNWSDSYYDIGPAQYCFVRTQQLGDSRLDGAIVPEQQNVAIVQQTTNITNITYNNTTIVNRGPNVDELRGQTTQPIARLRLQRENSVAGEARAVVRGDVVAMPAPVIAVQPQDRPRTVKQKIAQTSVEANLKGANQNEVESARAGMHAEATPPPNLPAKNFARPMEPPRPVMSATAPPVASVAPALPVRSTPVLTIPKTTPPPAATAPPTFAPRQSPAVANMPASPAQSSSPLKREQKEERRAEQKAARRAAEASPTP